MAIKVSIIFALLTILIQVAKTQCIGNSLNAGLNFNGFPYGNTGLTGPGLPEYGARGSNGGGFTVTSTSPIAPTGVSLLAENLAIEGPLTIGGQLPFLGSVGIEGALHSSGSGAVSHGCGSDNVAITSELGQGSGPYSLAGSGLAGPGLVGSYLASPGFGSGPVWNGLSGPALGGVNPGVIGTGFGPSFTSLGNGFPNPGFGAVNGVGSVLK